MGIKLLDSGEVIISARADPVHRFSTRWISQHTTDLAIVNVKISSTGDYQDGKKSEQITITFVAGISERCVTT